jgi:hypothetical protein
MKIRQVGSELVHADGRMDTDMAKLIVVFRGFTNALIKGTVFEF